MENFDLLEGRTKEWNSTDYQGKRKDQYESSAKSMMVGCIGLLLVVVSMIIYGIVS
jgi:hypothetical protein